MNAFAVVILYSRKKDFLRWPTCILILDVKGNGTNKVKHELPAGLLMKGSAWIMISLNFEVRQC